MYGIRMYTCDTNTCDKNASSTYGIHKVPSTGHEFDTVFLENFRHFVALQKIMEPTYDEWKSCGSYLMDPKSMEYEPSMHAKQLVFYDQAKNKHSMLEIGVHGGHSLLIALLASPHATIVCVDTCGWTHTQKCVEYLQREFPHRITLIRGDSNSVLPMLVATYDFVHVDGDHAYASVVNDLRHMSRLSSPDASLVIDDAWSEGVRKALFELKDVYHVTHLPECPWANCVVKKLHSRQ